MDTKARIKRFFASILESFGALWLIVEVTDYFFSQYQWQRQISRFWWLFLLIGIGVGAFRARKRKTFAAKILGTDVSVTIRIDDIFKRKDAVIVGTNSTFDTAIEDGTISPKSIQGQFTQKHCHVVADLDGQLSEGLASVAPERTHDPSDKVYGNRDEYELGTVIPIETSSRKGYFAAVARLNAHRVASVDRQEFLDALPKIWAGIRARGDMEPMCCPILGSVHSRLTLPRQQLAEEIIRSFVVATQEGKLSEELTLVIHPKDQDQVDFVRLSQFLKYQCEYGRPALVDTQTRGTETA